MKTVSRWFVAAFVVVFATTPQESVAVEIDSALSAGRTIPTVPTLMLEECSSVPVGVVGSGSGMCRQEAKRLVGAVVGCVITSAGFLGFGLKAAKVARGVAKAIRNGWGVASAISGGMAGLFYWDVWESFWDWDDCNAGLQSNGFLLHGSSSNEDELANLFDEAAQYLEDDRLPPWMVI